MLFGAGAGVGVSFGVGALIGVGTGTGLVEGEGFAAGRVEFAALSHEQSPKAKAANEVVNSSERFMCFHSAAIERRDHCSTWIASPLRRMKPR